MARVTIQMGHVARETGRTGTVWEQDNARSLAPRIERRLRDLGHKVKVIGADESVPAGDVFVALHLDGSTNTSRRGASVGYPDPAGGALAAAWKQEHQRAGYPGGFLADNYTSALRGYYGFGRAAGYQRRFLAEHGTATHAGDLAWIQANQDAMAIAHVNAIGRIVGHPKAGGEMPTNIVGFAKAPGGGLWNLGADGSVAAQEGAPDHGSLPGIGVTPAAPAVEIVAHGRGGYWIIGADGGIFAFGDAPVITPYQPLMDEYRRGERRVVDAEAEGDRVVLVSNRGEVYRP